MTVVVTLVTPVATIVVEGVEIEVLSIGPVVATPVVFKLLWIVP